MLCVELRTLVAGYVREERQLRLRGGAVERQLVHEKGRPLTGSCKVTVRMRLLERRVLEAQSWLAANGAVGHGQGPGGRAAAWTDFEFGRVENGLGERVRRCGPRCHAPGAIDRARTWRWRH